MKLCLALLSVGACLSVAAAQYDGPVPPRPIVPGAAPVGLPPGAGGRPSLRRRPVARAYGDDQPPPPPQRRQNIRGSAPRRLPPPLSLEQSLQSRPLPPRDFDEPTSRRQNLRPGPRRFPGFDQPQSQQQRALPPPSRPLYQDSPIAVVRPPILAAPPQIRPVIEDEDDEEDESYEDRQQQPQLQQPTQQPQPQQPQPSPPQLFTSLDDFPVPTRQQFRPQPQQVEEEQQQQQFVRQPRPQQAAPVRQHTQAEVTRQEPARPKPYAQQQYNRQQQVARPVQKEVAHTKASSDQPSNRQRKPTSQVLRKYRDDNPDGSITWGYENDDGSFKEETIGVDCVTRGKYGYVDPDGVRREYSYSSGIPCDKTQEDAETQASEGYIDYTNNKYVFANGATIDLDNMVRNRARKPVYRN